MTVTQNSNHHFPSVSSLLAAFSKISVNPADASELHDLCILATSLSTILLISITVSGVRVQESSNALLVLLPLSPTALDDGGDDDLFLPGYQPLLKW